MQKFGTLDRLEWNNIQQEDSNSYVLPFSSFFLATIISFVDVLLFLLMSVFMLIYENVFVFSFNFITCPKRQIISNLFLHSS